MFEFWIESEGEVEQQVNDYKLPINGEIYVGKRGTKRDVGAGYLHGSFFSFDINKGKAVSKVDCPDAVKNAVQYCTPDLIITENKAPRVAAEITFHKLTYNNVAQRLPRMLKCAEAGFDSFLFQLINPTQKMYNSWLAEALRIADSITPDSHCLPIFFDEKTAQSQLNLFRNIIKSTTTNNHMEYESIIETLIKQRKAHTQFYNPDDVLLTANGMKRSWIRLSDDKVKIISGVRRNCDRISGIECGLNHCQDTTSRRSTRQQIKEGTHLINKNNGEPVKCVWITKGTGGLDPYPGLALLGKLLFGYDSSGNEIRSLHFHFRHLPDDFWWLENNESEVYYKIIKEISDVVTYK